MFLTQFIQPYPYFQNHTILSVIYNFLLFMYFYSLTYQQITAIYNYVDTEVNNHVLIWFAYLTLYTNYLNMADVMINYFQVLIGKLVGCCWCYLILDYLSWNYLYLVFLINLVFLNLNVMSVMRPCLYFNKVLFYLIG